MANESSRHVRDVMTANPECVSEKDSIQDVARIMKSSDTGVVPVVDGKRIIGMITDRDIVVRGIAEGKDIANVRVNELMTKHVRSVREDATVNEALDMMSGAEIRRVAVVNSNDELVGIVSIGDISTNTNQDGKVGKTVESISQAPPNN
ncbi:MAG TPA: CBS domain-containing protein [Thermoanaerobaculia bacterium]|nr:CBS domain-containing protein [Thermoanaerobaculia bacterium]